MCRLTKLRQNVLAVTLCPRTRYGDMWWLCLKSHEILKCEEAVSVAYEWLRNEVRPGKNLRQ
jgi:hypothetical protein